MKLYYSEQELQNIKKEDAIDLISFEYFGEIYYYKDVQSIIVSEGTSSEPLEWKVYLNNDNFILLSSIEKLNDFKLKITRFELLKIKINIEDIEDIISEKVIDKIIHNLNLEIKSRDKIFDSTINQINENFNIVKEKYLEEISNLNNLKLTDFKEIIKDFNEIKDNLSELVE